MAGAWAPLPGGVVSSQGALGSLTCNRSVLRVGEAGYWIKEPLVLAAGVTQKGNGAMKNPDKFLIGIVAGILLLIVVAFVVVLTRPQPEYRNDDSPEAVVHNYLLALRLGDYETARESLSPNLKGYPKNAEAFADDVDENSRLRFDNRDVTLDAQSAVIRGNMATVEVLESSFTGGDLFNSGSYNRRFDMKLRQENGEWKLVHGDNYWTTCWERLPADATYCR